MNTIPNVNPSIETLRTDSKSAINFVESFFSGKQQKAISTDEERRELLEKLMVAQKTVDDSKRLESIGKITDAINNHNKLYTDKNVLPSELFSNDELIAAVKAIEGIEVQALFSDEELAAAGYTKKGNTQTSNSSTSKKMIPFKYITPAGEIKIGEIVDSGRVSENTGNKPEVIAFWNAVKDHKVERPDARVKEGQPAKPVMKKLGREEFANLTDDQLRKEFGHLVVAKA